MDAARLLADATVRWLTTMCSAVLRIFCPRQTRQYLFALIRTADRAAAPSLVPAARISLCSRSASLSLSSADKYLINKPRFTWHAAECPSLLFPTVREAIFCTPFSFDHCISKKTTRSCHCGGTVGADSAPTPKKAVVRFIPCSGFFIARLAEAVPCNYGCVVSNCSVINFDHCTCQF